MSVQEGSFGTVVFSHSVICEHVVSFTVSQPSIRIENWHASNEDLNLMNFDEFSMFFTMYLNFDAMSTKTVSGNGRAGEVVCDLIK